MASAAAAFHDFERILPAISEPLVADLHAWNEAQCPRPYYSLRTAMSHYLIGPDGSEPLADVKARLVNAIRRERLKAKFGDWSFDPLRLAAFADMQKTIEQFEREAG